MARVIVLSIFSTLMVLVLNLRDRENPVVSNEYFNFEEYKKQYESKKTLIAELENPPMEEHNHDEMMDEMEEEQEEEAYELTTEAEFKDGAYQVKMLNVGSNGEKMVFEPMFLRIKPGDKVTFVPVDKGHMSQTISGGIPSGGAEFASKVNETYTQTFTAEGSYAIKCKPHFTMGMVAMIVVGDGGSNLSQMESLKIKGKKGQKRWNAMLAELKASN
tara:strand:+ start:3210 stop:3860 length:651 start_codon:yes stop_codon:yes gene_type:complete